MSEANEQRVRIDEDDIVASYGAEPQPTNQQTKFKPIKSFERRNVKEKKVEQGDIDSPC